MASKPGSRSGSKATRSAAKATRGAGPKPRSATKQAGRHSAPARPAAAARSSQAVPSKAKKAAGATAPRSAGSERWARVTARDLMKKRTDLVTVPESAPLSEVERVLADAHVWGAPVVDSAERIVGVISVKDLLDRYTEDPDTRPQREHTYFRVTTHELATEDLQGLRVPEGSSDIASDVMAAQIFTVPASAGLKQMADTMCEHRVHRVLVEDDGKLVGLISTLDVLGALRD
jgi:CBS domain-containing protein